MVSQKENSSAGKGVSNNPNDHSSCDDNSDQYGYHEAPDPQDDYLAGRRFKSQKQKQQIYVD